MDTINRLQFRHHEEIFETREDALKYICKTLPREGGEGLAEPGSPYTRSLFAEPTILRYRNTEEEGTCENCNKGPHIILVIGSQTNDDDRKPEENKYCIIDIDKTEDEIKNLEEELEKAIRSLTIIALNSDTLNLYADKTEDGTIVSGDVKTAETHVFDGVVKENNLMVVPTGEEGGPEGLFIYVDLTYDETTETFTFVVTNADGTLKKQSVKLPNNYLVSGEYKKDDESIHLHMRNGDEVIVDCEQLIDEWKVEGEASTTPIVLTREEVGPDEDHHHTEPWQDILRADVRIADFIGTNILKKTTDGRYLYVDGKATNIIYYYNGELSNVSEQLDKLNKIKVSADNDNIIWNRTDGFFATAKLDYITNKNKLVFTTSTVSGGTLTKEIQLNSVELFQNIYYDRNTEELVITYKDSEGNLKVVRIPISDMFQEWDVLNDAHSVKLVKSPHHVAGKDILTADVNISAAENNILEERGEGNVHALFVRGTADNIKYKNTTVEGALDDLAAEDAAINEKLDQEIARSTAEDEKIETTIGSGFSTDAHETVTYKFDQLQEQVNSEADKLQNEIERSTAKDDEHDAKLAEQQAEIEAISADTAASLKDVINNDKSIDVDRTDPVRPVIKVNLSGNEPYNTLRLEGDGLYNFIDLNYDPDTNKLTLTRSDNRSTENVSKELQLNSVSIIDGMEYDPTTETLIIKYHSGSEQKELRIPLGEIFQEWEVYNDPDSAVKLNRQRVIDGKDKLSGEVIITSTHTDNILKNDHGALYVPANTDVTRALSGAITQEIQDRIGGDSALENAIQNSATTLDRAIETERTRAMSAETALRSDFVSGDTVLDHKIDSLETTVNSRIDVTENRLQAAIDSEKSRAEAADNLLDGKISIEKERAMTAESELRNAIAAETAARETKDEELSAKIDAATLEFDDTLSIDFNVPSEEGNVVRANVKLQEGDNIIKLGSGLYASVHLSYDPGTNKIKLVTSNGSDEEIQLVGASLLEDLHYDPVNKELVITYKDATGVEHTVKFGVSELFNEWHVENPSEKSAVELTKTPAAQPGGEDVLSARVLITDDRDGDGKPDEGSDNIIEIKNNGLYVKGNNEEVGCISGKTDAIYKTLFGGIAPGGCGEGIQYIPDPLSCVISGATSFMEADKMMAYQICEILEMWVSGMTCTSVSNWVDDGANKKMLVDVRPSYGKTAEMTSDDLYIIDLTGKTIEHGVTEFTDTNALRIVCLEDGGGVIPDISAKQNGIYLSNVWDCGKYYQVSTEAEEMAEVEASGYKVEDYTTDEDASSSSYNYMNNARQSDI